MMQPTTTSEEPVSGTVVTAVPPPPEPSSKPKGLVWFGSFMLVGLCIAIICIVLLRSSEEDDNNTGGGAAAATRIVDRQNYYTYLLETYSPLPGTPQDEAIDWLAFQDEPLGDDGLGPLDQRYALVVLYFTHGGTSTWNSINDNSLSGWINSGAGVHECDWKGVDCNLQKQVTGLRLSAAEGIILTGSSLSTEIGSLTMLQSLYMADQRVQGSIPSDWKALTNLIVLDLSYNEIRSTIPDFLGELDGLQSLLLGGNLLSGSIPARLEDSNIERLELQHNFGIEGRMENLLMNMQKLTYLDVSGTSVSGFLPSTEIQKLRALHARGSFVTGTVPSEISTWSSLTTLNLGQSGITGTIPSQLGLLRNLEAVNLSYLKMNGTLPTELSRLESISSLELRVSYFTGTLPTEYAQLRDLVVLDLAYNGGIYGGVPRDYVNMESLKTLYLHGTSLSGTIDPAICSLNLIHFTADCADRQLELACNCCTECFSLP